MKSTTDFVMERKGRLEDLDRSFDIEFWQRQGPQAIMEAAWQMALDAHNIPEAEREHLRLDRSVETIQRIRR